MILVAGSKGMLGHDLLTLFGKTARGACREDMDITSPASVRKVVLTLKPRVVINTMAFTNVDGSEEQQELAFKVNGEGAKHLAEATAEIGAKLVHVSTDYVFDGTKGSPYREQDPTNPLSIYGKSKLAGEDNVRLNPDHLIVRTQWLYGLHGRNFVETMLRLAQEKNELGIVNDQIGSPTWTVSLARAIKVLIEKDCRGVYHAVNSGSCSWFDFAAAIFAEMGVDIKLQPITSRELGRPAPRPLFSVLDCSKLLRDTGLNMEGWRDALKEYLKERD